MEDINKNENSQQEDFIQTSNQRENGWFLLDRFLDNPNLDLTESVLMTMLLSLSSNFRGFAHPSDKWLSYKLKVDVRTVRRKLTALEKKNLIWTHVQNTQKGRKREIVTPESALKYYQYLLSNKFLKRAKKFHDEFLGCIPNNCKSTVKETPHRPPANMSVAGPDNMSVAYNTTYYKDNTSDVTCKGSEDHAADSFDALEKELREMFTEEQVKMGLDWYSNRTEAQRSGMKKPIACIVNAIKKGYAEEELAKVNAEIAKELAKSKEKAKKEEESKQKKEKLKEKCMDITRLLETIPGFSYDIKGKVVFFYNKDLMNRPALKDNDGDTYYIMPDGTKMYGKAYTHHLSLTGELESELLALKAFLHQNKWDQEEQVSKLLDPAEDFL